MFHRGTAPRLYHCKASRLWQVAWTIEKREKTGRRHRVRKHFRDESEARDYLDNCLQLWRTGLLHHQEDASTALRLLQGTNVTLTELAERFLKKRQ